MKLIFLRHGAAAWGYDQDAERPLTQTGVQQLDRMIDDCVPELIQVDHAVVSPYLRAQQTFLQVNEQANITSVETSEAWLPETPLNQAFASLEALHACFEDKTLLIVSHNPLLSLIAGALCHGAGQYEPFDTGTIACVEVTYPAAELGHLLWKR